MIITWKITRVKGADIGAPYGTVVTDADYKVVASQEGSTLTGERSGVARLAKLKPLQDGSVAAIGVDANAFLQYDTVTEQDVVRWVKACIGAELVSVLENTVTHELKLKLDATGPTKPVELTPPWAQ